MATEPTVIRRYTPPTCALEIAAQQSPLSRWMGKSALKNLQFKLSFDDPRVSDDEWIVLRGDQTQLDALNQTVSDYVQSFLNRSSPPAVATIETDIAAATATAAAAVATEVPPIEVPPVEVPPIEVATAGMLIQPQGLLSHELTLGSLATDQAGDKLTLSSTQLADLSSALDEYSAEATTLPNLDRKVVLMPNIAQWSSPNWAGLAAGLLVAVGLGTSLVNGLGQRSPSTETASQASSSDQRLAVPPPTVVPTPTPDPFSTLPPLASLPNVTTLPSPLPGAKPGASTNKKKQTTSTVIPNVPAPRVKKPPVSIVDIPQRSNSQPSQPPIKIAKSFDPKRVKSAPVPPIIDNIGGSAARVPVDAIPDQTKVSVQQAQKRAEALLELQRVNSASRRQAKNRQTSRERAAVSDLPSLEPAPPAELPAVAAAKAPPQPVSAGAVAAEQKSEQEFFDNRHVQAAAVRRYFKQRWQPPKDLKQSVQYDIELNPNGSLKRADSVGSEADRLRSQAGVPAAGAPIAPAAKNGKPSKVRVLLEQDGAVQAFPQ